MAAIFGCVDFNERFDLLTVLHNMKQTFERYPLKNPQHSIGERYCFGRFDSSAADGASPNSNPWVGLDQGLMIVADSVFYNWKALLTELGEAGLPPEPSVCQLIGAAYRKWGVGMLTRFVGDFAFAIYDPAEQRLVVARDPLGKRVLYFRRSDGILAFSTLINSLRFMHGPEGDPGISTEWLTLFLSVEAVKHELDDRLTSCNDIFYVRPGHYLSITPERFEETRYWSVLNKPQIHYRDRREYGEELLHLLEEAVHCRIETAAKPGILLSSGLDSGAVGCLAARELAAHDKRLRSYTAVPMAGYRHWFSESSVADETQGVKAIGQKYPNIDQYFCSCPETDSLKVIDRLVEGLEGPYKFIGNSYWLDSIIGQASLDGCDVLLGGQYGNATVSFGSFRQHLFTLLKEFRLPSYLNAVEQYCRKEKISRRVFHRRFLSQYLQSCFPRRIHRPGSRLLREDILEKHRIDERLRAVGYSKKPFPTLEESRAMWLETALFNQMGSIETKLELMHHIALRDPTRDQRVVEFCMRLPYDAFAAEGTGRRLVRDAMAGVVPDEVLHNYKSRGKQGADWLQRIECRWPEVCLEVRSALGRHKILRNIVNPIEFEKMLDDNNSVQYLPERNARYRTLMTFLTVARYIETYEKGVN